VSHRLYPTGRAAGGKGPRGGARGGEDDRGVVLTSGDRHPDPPPAPAWLAEREAELYDRHWQEPIAVLWPSSSAHAVARLAALEHRVETRDAPGWVFGAILRLERELLLDAGARARLGIVVDDEPENSARVRNLPDGDEPADFARVRNVRDHDRALEDELERRRLERKRPRRKSS
jgi:hypothetical protein